MLNKVTSLMPGCGVFEKFLPRLIFSLVIFCGANYAHAAITVTSATVAANGASVTVNFDEAMTTYISADCPGALLVRINGQMVTMTSCSGAVGASAVTITFPSTKRATSTDTVTLSYAYMSTPTIVGASGNLATFSNSAVTNNSTLVNLTATVDTTAKSVGLGAFSFGLFTAVTSGNGGYIYMANMNPAVWNTFISGLTISNGVVSGTATAVHSATNLTFVVVDPVTNQQQQAVVSLTVVAAADPTPTLIFATPTSATVAMGSTLTNTASSSISSGGAGAITYSSATSGVATVNSTTGVVTPVSAGTSVITATQAAASGVNAQATQTYTVTVSLAQQGALTASASPSTIVASTGTSTLSTSGGSGSGAVTYAVTGGASSCTLSGNTVTATSTVGACTITATKAAQGNYASSTATVTITVANLTAQATLYAAASPSAISKNTGTSNLSTTGGSGSGAVSYAVTSGTCTVSGSTLIAGSAAETCTVTATKSADSTYSSTTATVNIVVNNRASIADAVNQSVIGTVTAQATVAQRFANAQVNNISSHIQGLRNGFNLKANQVSIGISSPELSQANPVLQKISETIAMQAKQAVLFDQKEPQLAYSRETIEVLVKSLNDARNSGSLTQILSLYAGSDHSKVKASLKDLKAGEGESKIISIKALGSNEFMVLIERAELTDKVIIPLAIQINKDGQYELRYSEVELVKSIQASNKGLYGASGQPIKVKATASTQLAQTNISPITNQSLNQELFGDAPFGIWAAGNIDYGHMNIAGGSNKFGMQGITFGIDFQVQKNLIIGAALGYGFDRTDIDTLGSNVKSDQISLSAYSIYQPEKDWFVDALLGFGSLNMKNNRYSSAANSVFSADRKGDNFYGSFGVGNMLRFYDVKLQPYARAAYTATTLDAYTEGLNANALGYDKSKLISSSVSAGLLVSEDFSVEGGKVTPSAKFEIKRNARGTINQNIYYADTPSENTVLSMTPAPQNVQSFGLGVVYVEKSNGASLGLNWLGSVGSNSYRSNAVKADVRVPF